MSTAESDSQALELRANELPKKQEVNAFSRLPQTFEQAQKYCNYLASSTLVPKAYQGKPNDVFVAITWGQEVGLSAMNSLRNMAVINGRPSLWGDAPIALVRSSPKCEMLLEDNEAFAYARDHIPGWEHLKDKDPDSTSICVGKRVGEPPQAREFSVEDVKKANLGNVHKQYPKDMRKYKARSRLIDSLFADITNGLGQAEIAKEQAEIYGEDTQPSNDNSIADDVMNELSAKKPTPEEEAEDAEFEEVPDEEEDTGPELASDKDVQHVLDSAKYLDKRYQDKLIKETKSEEPMTKERAQYWKSQIRIAYNAKRAKKESKDSE